MVGSGTAAAHVRQHLVQKRSRVSVVVVFGKHMSFGEQRSPIFLLTTDVHRDNFNVFYKMKQNEKRSLYMRQEKILSC